MKAMQFVAYGGPEQLHLNDLPRPSPGDGEMLIEIRATSINPIDWKLHGGMLRWVKRIRFPSTPCFDFAGTVAALGPGVRGFGLGDRVFGMLPIGPNGAAAEFAIVPAHLAAKLPDSVDFRHGAGMPLAGMTALQALRDDGGLRSGQDLLVIGASGGVGHYAVQLGKVLGAKVTGICSSRNVVLVRELGADTVLDYTQPNFRVPAESYDVILDAVSHEPVDRWLPALRAEGRYCALLPGLGLAWQGLLARLTSRQRLHFTILKPRRDDLEFLAGLASANRLHTVIDQVLPLAEIGAAFVQSQSGRTRGKVIVEI